MDTERFDHGADCREMLERLVDSSNLSCVLECLAVVCQEKADHVLANWQDAALAAAWRRAAGAVTRASQVRAVVVLP